MRASQVAVYDKALSADEVTQNYVAAFSQPHSHVVATRWYAGACQELGWGIFWGHTPKLVITPDGDGALPPMKPPRRTKLCDSACCVTQPAV